MKDMRSGTIHNTLKNGKLKIVKYYGDKKVIVQFISTGTVVKTQSGYIRRGIVKDYNHKSILGVGFIGVGCHKPKTKGILSNAYKTWNCIITRCYSSRSLKLSPTYIDCSVCVDWHNFQNFASWYYDNYPNDGKRYALDKDKLILGNRVYSPETCLFISHAENAEIAHARKWRFVDPDGVSVCIYNLSKFCKENKLCNSSMASVHNGKRDSYKGWKSYFNY